MEGPGVPVDASTIIRERQLFPWLWLLAAATVFFVILAELFGESKDWENYNTIFESLRVFGREGEDEGRIELGFKWLSAALIGLSLPNLLVYAVIAAVSITIKCYAVNFFCQSRAAFAWAIAFMLICFTPLHELTQLRAATAIAVVFLAYAALILGRYWLAALLSSAAIIFHVSSVVLLPAILLLLIFEREIVVLTRAKAILMGSLVYLAGVVLIAIVLDSFGDILLVVSVYQEEGFGFERLNPFSASVVLNTAMTLLGFLLWNSITPNMRYVLLFQTFGTAVFYSTIEFQVVAQRVFELFQVFWIFYVADGEQSEDFFVRYSTRFYVLAAAAAYSYIYFFSGTFFL